MTPNPKGKSFETDYFIKEDMENRHRISEENKRKQKSEKEAALKNLHFMKCPKCGHDLITKRISYIDIDQCENCGTLVLAPKDVDKFLAEEKSILKSLVDFFKG